jgi:hypothetical protein
MARFVRLLVAPTLMLLACANPEFQDPGSKTNNNTAKGPDLGSFIQPDTGDMAKPPVGGDMAKPPGDMALMSSPDLAMTPADMSMASTGGCGSITYDGICVGDLLKYCDAGTLRTIDCWNDYFASCEVISGVADCYF